MTLPACVISLPSPPDGGCPAGQHWNGTQCVADTGITPPGETGTGDLIYLATWQKGLGICLNAPTSPVWFNGNGVSPNNLTGDALKILAFNLDPGSLSVDHYTQAYAMTLGGFYKATGLPSVQNWSKVLDISSIAALAPGYAEYKFAGSFALSTLVKDQVSVLVMARHSDYNTWVLFIYSPDGGATWNYDGASCYVGQYDVTFWAGIPLLYTACIYEVQASNHLTDIFYINGNIIYDQSPGNLAGFRSTLDKVHLGDATTTHFQTFVTAQTARYSFPYSNPAGVVYLNDDVAYHFSDDPAVLSLVDTTIAPPTANPGTSVKPVGMTYTTAYQQFYAHALNENYLYFLKETDASVWVSSNRASTWTNNAVSSAGLSQIITLYPLLKDRVTLFVAGIAAGGGFGRCFYSGNFGAAWTRFDNPGSGSLDSVLGISSGGDVLHMTIMADRYYATPDGVPSAATATMLDVSHYQGTMNWATALAQGITHTFIKATQGSGYTDPQFATNWSGANAQGIQRGSYHYFENATDPIAQANHYVAVATSAGELGYAVDCEDETALLDPTNLKSFLDRVETLTGQKCTIYTRASWWNRYVGFQAWASQYPLWVAHWNAATPTLPVGWDFYTYWQFSSLGNGATYGASSAFVDLDKVNA